MACCGACCRPRAGYKGRVAACFPRAADANSDAGAVSSLIVYANRNSDKLPGIGKELEKRIVAELARRRDTQAVNGAFALNKLVKSCHRELRLFYPHLVGATRALLACPRRALALVGAELFVTFAHTRSGTAPVQSDVDVFVAAFVDMANCSSGSERERQAQRIGGLRGLQAYFSLLDEHLSRLASAAPRLTPTIFANLRYAGAPCADLPTNRLAAEAQAGVAGTEPLDDDEPPSVRALARECLHDVAERTATTDVKSLVHQALDYVDSNALWTAQSETHNMSFAAELLSSICDALKPHDYQTAIDCVLARLSAEARGKAPAAASDAKKGASAAAVDDTLDPIERQTAIAETLRACIRRGMLTVHQLVRSLLQQTIDSLRSRKRDSAAHVALRTALVRCVVAVGSHVDQSKRLDTLDGVARQLKAIDDSLSKAAARRSACLLLVRAFADIAGELEPLTEVDRSDAFFSTLLHSCEYLEGMYGTERVEYGVAMLDALRALVVVAPPRTEADDDITGALFESSVAAALASTKNDDASGHSSGDSDESGGGGSDDKSRKKKKGKKKASSSGSGADADASVDSAEERLAKRKEAIAAAATEQLIGGKKSRRARNDTGNIGAVPRSAYVERHERIVAMVDRLLFPPAGDSKRSDPPALSQLVASGGSLLLAALVRYGAGEALRSLPYIFHLQATATDMPDASAPSTSRGKKHKKKSDSGDSSDPSALHELVGAYLAALVEQLDSDELRATVAHTLEQRKKKKQLPMHVVLVRDGDMPMLEYRANHKRGAKRITITFERASIVAMLQRESTLKKYGHLSARLAAEWDATRAAATTSALVRPKLARQGNSFVYTPAFPPASEQDSRQVSPRGGGSDGVMGGPNAIYPHNAPRGDATPEPLCDAVSFLAVLHGDAQAPRDRDVDDFELTSSIASDDEDDDEDDEESSGGMQLSDSGSRSKISVSDDDEDDGDDDDDKKAKAKSGGKGKKVLKKKAKAKKSQHPADVEQRRHERVKRLRERSFEEAEAVAQSANARLRDLVLGASMSFASELAPDFVNDEGDDTPESSEGAAARAQKRFDGTYLPCLDVLLARIDASPQILNDGNGLPRLRDEPNVGELVVRSRIE